MSSIIDSEFTEYLELLFQFLKERNIKIHLQLSYLFSCLPSRHFSPYINQLIFYLQFFRICSGQIIFQSEIFALEIDSCKKNQQTKSHASSSRSRFTGSSINNVFEDAETSSSGGI
jgi:hypothetical protein